jgi:hypothetical protein
MYNNRSWYMLATVVASLATGGRDLTAQASKGVHVCLGTDNVLRFTSGTACPQGQRMFRLAEVEDEVGVTKDRDDPPNAVVADLKTKVDFLTKRVANLEAEAKKPDNDPGVPTQVKAPFEVVDKRGAPILVVTDAPYKSVPRKGAVHIGHGSSTNYDVWVHDGGMRPVAAMGESTVGGGQLFLANAKSVVTIDLTAEQGIIVGNSSGKGIINLAASERGSGQLLVKDSDGSISVEMGTLPEGEGVVRLGPTRECVPTIPQRVPLCIRGRGK